MNEVVMSQCIRTAQAICNRGFLSYEDFALVIADTAVVMYRRIEKQYEITEPTLEDELHGSDPDFKDDLINEGA